MPIKNAAPPLAGGPADALPHAGHQLDRRGRENMCKYSHESVAQGARRRLRQAQGETARAGDATGRGTGHYPKGLHETPEDVQAGDARQGPLQE